MRTRVTDLNEWARRHSSEYGKVGKWAAEGAGKGIFILLAEAIKAAPKHTRALRRSLRVRDRMQGSRVELAIQSDDPAAGMQESGGLLRGRPLMSVPIGVERAYWDATGTRRTPAQIPGLFQIRAKSGRLYLVTRVGRTLILRFERRRYVRQEGQGWATEAMQEAQPKLALGIEGRLVEGMLATDRIAP